MPVLEPVEFLEVETVDLGEEGVGDIRRWIWPAYFLIDVAHFILKKNAVVIRKDPRVGRKEIQRADTLVDLVRKFQKPKTTGKQFQNTQCASCFFSLTWACGQ